MRTLPLVLLATLALSASGCGGSDSSSPTPTTTNSVASAPGATAPPTDATQPGTGTVTTQTQTQTQTRTQPKTTSVPQYSSTTENGAPRTRMPASFVVRHGRLTPPGISGPAGIPIDVTVISQDGKAHTLLLEVPPKPRRLSVAPGGKAALRIAGLRAGAYGIELDGRVAGGLVIGREPGP
jgi:hypothetical protein